MNLTFEDYQKFGGKVDNNTFPLLWQDCENHLRTITFGRLKELDDDAKRLAVKVIDSILEPSAKYDPNVKSYSNGITSISYDTSYSILQSSIMDLAKTYLPNEMLYRGAK